MIFFSCFSSISAATIPISSLPVGKVIKIGSKSFVKVRQDLSKGAQFLALTPVSYQQTFNYTGDVQTWIVPYSGTYQIELWGARGGETELAMSGKGGYVKGTLTLDSGTALYLYVGSLPSTSTTAGGFNGGGTGYSTGKGGGGATDVRLVNGTWNETNSLRSRIIVAAGGGGNSTYTNIGHTGGLEGYTAWDSNYSTRKAYGGTQIAGGSVNNYPSSYPAGTVGGFGYGGNGGGAAGGGSFGGGAGYYGGGGGSRLDNGNWPGGGGSSYISGHTGCVAITSATDQTPKSGCTTGTSDYNCSLHYSGKVFTDTVMIDGAGYSWTNVKGNQIAMPNPAGGSYALGVGHTGNGVARITLI